MTGIGVGVGVEVGVAAGTGVAVAVASSGCEVGVPLGPSAVLGVAVSVGVPPGPSAALAVGSTATSVVAGLVTLRKTWADAPPPATPAVTVAIPWFSQPAPDGTAKLVINRPSASATELASA
jgi:hypothetical protein